MHNYTAKGNRPCRQQGTAPNPDMPRLVFAPTIQRHVAAPPMEVRAGTVAAALECAFAEHPALRGYLLDDQGQLRRHLAIFIDGAALHDRRRLSDAAGEAREIYVAQALSGG